MLSTGKKRRTNFWLVLWLVSLMLAACTSQGSQGQPTPTSAQSVAQATISHEPVEPTAELPGETPAQAPAGTPVAAATSTSPSQTPVAIATETQEAQSAISLPVPDTAAWQLFVKGLRRPVGIANAGDGSGRLFIVEQRGSIRIIQDGAVINLPFLDIRDRVGVNASEQGLLGLAFHPNYKENGYFFVNYTDLNGDTVIARFSTLPEDPNRADPASEQRLIFLAQPYPNHNGGSVVFGPDGYLYLGLGDGGSANDPQGNGQSTRTLLGKILRIDVDQGDPYAVPEDNPFAAGGGLAEIWDYGLRNPWRFTFDRSTGDMYIADVGQNQWEEINYLPSGHPGGANFGWDYREGAHEFEGSPPGDADLIDPVAEYAHNQGCSVTGGVVYRGSELPEWSGVYLYGDYCSGLLWGLLRQADGSWQNSLLYETGAQITSFGEDENGEVYLTDHSGSILRLNRNP